MKLIFNDPSYSFELVRALGGAYYGGADIGECLNTAYRIKEGDDQSWYQEWLATAERVFQVGESCSAKGHKVSAREAYLRASSYYRSAEFFLHSDPNDQRALGAAAKSRQAFQKALPLLSPPGQALEIPYENATIPGYFSPASEGSGKRPLMIVITGFDGTGEEIFMGHAFAFNRRGYHFLTIEGPGQGRCIRGQKLYFRPDWEKVMTPVVDFALKLPGVDAERVALMGLSFGGYLAPRAAAFEHRLAACVANGGVYDFAAPQFAKMPPFMVELIDKDPAAFDAMMKEGIKNNPEARWALQDGMWKFNAPSFAGYMKKLREYNLKACADKITCKTLVIDSEAEQFFPGQAQELFDALKCPKELLVFTVAEGAELHCQMGAAAVSHQRICDWLDDSLK
jgi:alpha-beta hydrolase superfamily lysophospholipase